MLFNFDLLRFMYEIYIIRSTGSVGSKNKYNPLPYS